MRHAIVILALAACGSRTGGKSDGDPDAHVDPTGDGQPSMDGAPSDAVVTPDAPSGPDAFVFPSKLDLQINCRNDCVLIANPASIAVPAGTKFTVNWVNVGDTDCDVAKIDQFNQVPIIIGLEPGTSYHDNIREWCGMFTGTFQFRISICTIHSYIPVNCGA
jgi:hypothetical protein